MRTGILEGAAKYLTVENVKFELMRTAYGNPASILFGLDARVLICWYLGFSLIPWFFYDLPTLAGLLLIAVVLAVLCRVSLLIISLMAFGFITQIFTTTIFALFFGGEWQVLIALLTVAIKMLIVSLATVAVFTSMDPEKLSDALLRFGLPDRFCFSISYGYRILPVLIDEYNSIFNSFRLRGRRPRARRLGGLNILVYYTVMIVKSFYPMLLNTAKRVKTTVEALETKGFSRSFRSRKVMTLRFSYMKITPRDIATVATITLCAVSAIVLGRLL